MYLLMNPLKVEALFIVMIIISPSITFAAKHIPKGEKQKSHQNELFEAVNEFCDTTHLINLETCQKTLRSDPRSASAKDQGTLTTISIDLALAETTKTRDYLVSILPKIPSNDVELQSALKDCISAYQSGVGSLAMLPQSYQEDRLSASYDMSMAYQTFQGCENSLNSHKIVDPSILDAHRNAYVFVNLTMELQE
ncbi:OLC1v1004481C2 [Oldenlandia corymbosa var. corymbosa]|nr:OLC1v1004481C2 [Oldenlandia corymbosa var. corymbosa]